LREMERNKWPTINRPLPKGKQGVQVSATSAGSSARRKIRRIHLHLLVAVVLFILIPGFSFTENSFTLSLIILLATPLTHSPAHLKPAGRAGRGPSSETFCHSVIDRRNPGFP